MPKEQRTFSKEFKMEAVRLVNTSGNLGNEFARDLGISDSTIHNRRKQLAQQGEQAFPRSGHQIARWALLARHPSVLGYQLCWLLRIFVLEKGKKHCGKPCPFCGKKGRDMRKVHRERTCIGTDILSSQHR